MQCTWGRQERDRGKVELRHAKSITKGCLTCFGSSNSRRCPAARRPLLPPASQEDVVSPADTMSPVLWLLMSQNPPFVWSFTSRCTHTFLTEGSSRLCALPVSPAEIISLSNSRIKGDRSLWPCSNQRQGAAVPCSSASASPFRWGLIYNPNCGNDDEESIGDYEALSHIVRRWSAVMQREDWEGARPENTGRTHTELTPNHAHQQGRVPMQAHAHKMPCKNTQCKWYSRT